jgi:fatty acid-binding protein DegV
VASALLGSALAIKPLLALSDGHIAAIEKVRTSVRALSRLEELALKAAEAAGETGVDIAVHHLDSKARASDLVERLRARVASTTTVVLVELGAVVGAHVGPGTIAVAVSPRPSAGQH